MGFCGTLRVKHFSGFYFSIEEEIGLSLRRRMSAGLLTKSRPALDEVIVKARFQVVPQNIMVKKKDLNPANGLSGYCRKSRCRVLFEPDCLQGVAGELGGYVAFFLLQDLVTEDCSAVRFFLPFEDFNTSPLPGSLDAYLAYRQLAVDFIEARNRRILESC